MRGACRNEETDTRAAETGGARVGEAAPPRPRTPPAEPRAVPSASC